MFIGYMASLCTRLQKLIDIDKMSGFQFKNFFQWELDMIAGVLCLLFKNDSRFCVKGAFKKDGLGVAKAEAKQNFC